MGVSNFEDLMSHVGHKIECVCYGDPPVNVALECLKCNEVLMDYDLEASITQLEQSNRFLPDKS